MTLLQAKEWLAGQGLTMPDFVLQAIIDSTNSIDACLNGAGYPLHTKLMIKLYLITLISLSQAVRYMSSASSPSGASIGYSFTDGRKAFANTLSLLKGLDKSGCTNDLIPDFDTGKKAGLWIARGGCK